MLVDKVTLYIKAGDGGNGAATFLRNGLTAKGGPDGGNGGNGGHIYFQGSHNINDLKMFRFKKKVIAENGIPGKHKKLFGANAAHTIIYVPVGTQITTIYNGKMVEITDTTTPVLLARGGTGGRGNTEFKSATNQSPYFAEKGTRGQTRDLLLELKIIAEIGLIGLPNAGKSSLLSVITNAEPKIGDYPFTTLEPNIGMLDGHMIADIPGLIEGASEGKGLGVTFLKHIEKTKILIHCIDSSDEQAKKTYETVRKEFKNHNPELLEKPEVVLLTKTDLITPEVLKKQIAIFKKMGKDVHSCTLFDEESIKQVKKMMEKALAAATPAPEEATAKPTIPKPIAIPEK